LAVKYRLPFFKDSLSMRTAEILSIVVYVYSKP